MMALRRAVALNLMMGRNKAWPKLFRIFDMTRPVATACDRVRENRRALAMDFTRESALKISSQQ
jgi:hypothetical protein